jgi:hypothetical protein
VDFASEVLQQTKTLIGKQVFHHTPSRRKHGSLSAAIAEMQFSHPGTLHATQGFTAFFSYAAWMKALMQADPSSSQTDYTKYYPLTNISIIRHFTSKIFRAGYSCVDDTLLIWFTWNRRTTEVPSTQTSQIHCGYRNKWITTISERFGSQKIPDGKLGQTFMSIYHMRAGHSNLKASLSRFNIVSTAECECGDGLQMEEHVFWDCKLYEEQRQ